MEQNIAERKIIAEKIAQAYENAGKKVDFDAFDLVLSFQPPLQTDLSLTVVDKEHNPLPGDKAIQRIEDWTQTFNRGKWRGYLFVAPHVDRKLAGEAFRQYLNEWKKK